MSLAIAVLLTLAGFAQDSRTHVDERAGYKLRPPKEWTAMPVEVGESTRVAKFVCPRSYFWTPKGGGWTREHKPELTVLAFAPLPAKEKGTPPSAHERYLAHLERANFGRGYVIEKNQVGELEGVPVRKLDLRLPELANGAPGRVLAWVFDSDDLDIAVQFELYDDAFEKLENELESALKTFRRVPRTGAPDTPAPKASASAKTPYERRVQRQALEKELHDKALASLPAGWKAKRMGRFLVLNHGDERAAARLVENGEALLEWLETSFAFVGPEEYVRAPILRVCKNSEEEFALQRGNESWSSFEIVTHDPRDDWIRWSAGSFNARVAELWFSERDRELYQAFPPWLSWGLRDVAGDAVFDKGKLEFKDDEWDRDQLRERVREGRMRSPRDVLQAAGATFMSNDDWGVTHDAAALVRFLVGPAARKQERTKELLASYVRNLRAVLDESAPPPPPDEPAEEPAGEPAEPPKLDPEQLAALTKKYAERQRELIDAVFARTFGAWTDADWKDFEKLYFKTMF